MFLVERRIRDKGKHEGRCFPEQGDFGYSGEGVETIQREAWAEIETGPQWKEAPLRAPRGAGRSLLERHWSLWIGVQAVVWVFAQAPGQAGEQCGATPHPRGCTWDRDAILLTPVAMLKLTFKESFPRASLHPWHCQP